MGLKKAISLLLALLIVSISIPLLYALMGFGGWLIGMLFFIYILIIIFIRENKISAMRYGIRLRDISSQPTKNSSRLTNIIILITLLAMIFGPMIIYHFMGY